eukprot:6455107-Amphidinium_carterae.3
MNTLTYCNSFPLHQFVLKWPLRHSLHDATWLQLHVHSNLWQGMGARQNRQSGVPRPMMASPSYR